MEHQYKGYGENIYAGGETDEKAIVMKWFMERNIYTYENNTCHPNKDQKMCGHYRQVSFMKCRKTNFLQDLNIHFPSFEGCQAFSNTNWMW